MRKYYSIIEEFSVYGKNINSYIILIDENELRNLISSCNEKPRYLLQVGLDFNSKYYIVYIPNIKINKKLSIEKIKKCLICGLIKHYQIPANFNLISVINTTVWVNDVKLFTLDKFKVEYCNIFLTLMPKLRKLGLL